MWELIHFSFTEMRALNFCSIFGLPWIKTISVDAKTDIKKKTAQYENASAYLFDTKKSDSFGGTGKCLTGI